MIELEKLLNSLYVGVPVDQELLEVFKLFSFTDTMDERKCLLEFLDDIVINHGKNLISNIAVHKTDNSFQLKITTE